MDDNRKPPAPTVLVAEEPQPVQLIQRSDGRLERPGVRFESGDIRFLPIVVTTLLLGATLGIAAGFVRWFLPGAARQGTSRQAFQLPKQPRLELLAPPDLPQPLAEQKLHHYGPVDEPGFVHIPIEQAMRVVATELQSSAQPSAKIRTAASGDGNSGRLLPGATP